VLPCVAVCCSVLQCVAVCSSVLQCVAVCCSVLQCIRSVAVCGRLTSWQRRWVMSHMSMSHVTHVKESCHTCQWVMSHTSQHTAAHCNILQHIATHCNTLQHTGTHCNTPEEATLVHAKSTQRLGSADSRVAAPYVEISGNAPIPVTCVTWLIYMCDMSHSYVRRDSFTCARCDSICRNFMLPSLSHMRHDSLICAT